VTFDPNALRRHLARHKIATLPELKEVLGAQAGLTIFRKLKELGYFSSYTHRGRYYTLASIPRFDDDGLWSWEGVWFSRYGSLLATVETFVNRSPDGYFAEELASSVHAEVQEPLRALVRRGRLSRCEVKDVFLYTSTDPQSRRKQLLSRRTAQALPIVSDISALRISPDELKAALLLFYSLLDEQQRRLYAGLESLRLGRGGDSRIADFLGLDAHTVARGRQQLLDQDVVTGAVRHGGGGRPPTEKKRPM
jgi:hypothetical protein